jgi:uncharacterized membrane protein
MAIAVALHALAAVVWVGGMFFAHQCLRPVLADAPPPQRLAVMAGALKRFFVWVWLAVAVLLASGLGQVVALGGFAAWGPHVNLMMGLGIVMMLLFGHLYFAPNRRLQAAVARADWAVAGQNLGTIRRIVEINLVLGLVTVAVGASGRYWGG